MSHTCLMVEGLYLVVGMCFAAARSDCHDVGEKHWIDGGIVPIANPMSGYKEYAASRKSWGINVLGSLVVDVEADDVSCGVGVIIGGQPGAYIVEKDLSRFIEGQDPRDVELIWDQMFKSTLNYGRKGLPVQAISSVDLALWDLLGKLRNEPVYVLGGKTKDRLPDEPLPAEGFTDLPLKSGFGVTLYKDKPKRPYPRPDEESRKQAKANIERKPTVLATFPF